jgi:single-strand DNA-binding protein
MINKVIVLGRVGKDVESRSFDGSSMASISLATSKSYKKGDEWIEKTEWHDVSCWGSLADKVSGLRKGELVFVEGELNTRSYEKDGQRQYRTYVKASYIRRIV